LVPSGSAQTIWREAEKPDHSTMNRHPWWYDKVKRDQLSGGDWISNFSEAKEGLADYQIEVPKAGRYTFWVRANPVSTKLSYALDRDDWTPIAMEKDSFDGVNVADDGKPDLRFLAWKKVGELSLTKGRHVVRFRMHSDNNHHGALDAFVLTTEPFQPSGTRKPGDAVSRAAGSADAWPFQPDTDNFSDDAAFDLRSLNESVAGQGGFLRLSPDGNSFVLGAGAPVRLWPVTTYVQRDRSIEDLAHHARFLAKRGVNMVRFHGQLHAKGEDAAADAVDEKELDAVWRLVAAMKKEGIYTTLSPYWSMAAKPVPASWGLEGWPAGEAPGGLLFFNPNLQRAYKAWWKAALTRPNPYTGIPLAQDPALAILQLQNEDSLLFWTAQNIKGKQAEILGEQFGRWLKTKYRSLEGARKAWQNDAAEGDDWNRGVVGLCLVWEWTQARQGGRKQRLDDQLEFYAQTMAQFNRDMARYLRDELGCRQLVNAGNWKSADALKLDDAERWSYTANDVLAVNRYYSPIHLGPDNGWRIDPGDRFQNLSVLTHPRDLPVSLKQVLGHPMLVTESHWVPPLGYLSEGPFLVAAYQSLSGVDGFYWFGTGETEWSNADRSDWDSASRAKWSIATPMIQGQFPATALLFRRSYVKQGEPAVVEHRPLRDLWQRVPPRIAEDPGYDTNRDLGETARRTRNTAGIDPLAFLVGPVEVVYGSDAGKSHYADLKKYVHEKEKSVTSNTGELVFRYGTGVCTVDAPCAQGATGFLKEAGAIALTDLSIRSKNAYATVLAVSLDGAPLAKSTKVLVQVGTVARPEGWSTEPAQFTVDDGKRTVEGEKIVSTGRMPWMIEKTHISLGLANPALATATALDVNGRPRGAVDVKKESRGVRVDLPPDALYVVFEAESRKTATGARTAGAR
jgi:hypothetical protein